jgi:hypothetical protein
MTFIASTSFGAITGLSVDKEHIPLISDILLIVLIYSVSVEMGMDRDNIRRSIYAASKYWYVWVGTIIGSLMSGMVIQYISNIRFSVLNILITGDGLIQLYSRLYIYVIWRGGIALLFSSKLFQRGINIYSDPYAEQEN